MAGTYNPATQKAEAEGWKIQGQPGLHGDFQASLGYKEASGAHIKTRSEKNKN